MIRGNPFAFVRERVTRWDLIAIIIVIGLIAALAEASRDLLAPLSKIESAPLPLDPAYLPFYAARTSLRMFAALGLSLLFTLTYATAAAKNARAGKLLIPILDILQSVPILGFISVTVVFFMSLVPGRVLGAEFAAIFAIFTSQAWNMAFGFYQSLRTVPTELREASDAFHLSAWMRFWQLEVPFALPSLIWNTMMSMSGGWFFVVASESISVGHTSVALPGIGSYIALAIEQRNLRAVGWAIATMLVVILLFDQILFRPLVAWVDRLRFEQDATGHAPRSWALTVVQRSHVGALATRGFYAFILRISWLRPATAPTSADRDRQPGARSKPGWGWPVFIGLCVALALWSVVRMLGTDLRLDEVMSVLGLAFFTMLRVFVLIVLASLVWVPIGVWVGMRPRAMEIVQPIAQFLAAFPANLLFPVAVFGVVTWQLNPDIWLSPLMILGTQWYILFNVIAGASAIPGELRYAAQNFGVSRWLWWRKFALPAVLPFYVTGAITASGGSWNASIVAELASWGHTEVKARGLGAYIAEATAAGDFHRIVLGIVTMCLFVVLINSFLWRPLYYTVERRFRLA